MEFEAKKVAYSLGGKKTDKGISKPGVLFAVISNHTDDNGCYKIATIWVTGLSPKDFRDNQETILSSVSAYAFNAHKYNAFKEWGVSSVSVKLEDLEIDIDI